MVSCFGLNKIKASGYNVIRLRRVNKNNVTIVMSKTCQLIIIPDFKPNFKDYSLRFPSILKNKSTGIFYKAVHKLGDKYFSHHDSGFEYIIGEKHTNKCDQRQDNSCSFGLHVSDKGWALGFGMGWANMALIECEVAIKNIVVSKDCDGKVRTSELKVVREVPKEEWI